VVPSRGGTRRTLLRLWFDWCEQHHLEPLADVRRPHVELYARDLEARGLAPATVALKLVVLTGFYRYCVEEQLLEHSPAVHVRRPKISQESTRLGLDRSELGAFLVQAGLSGGTDHALACLLALNALRVSEACGADLCDLALANGHRVVRIVGEGNQPALIPLAPRTSRAIDAAVGERTDGPLLARADGSRLDRHAAGRIVRRLAKRAGIDKPISPRSLRHAAITAALDAGCSLRDVQDFARHSDPRQTRRCDRARGRTRPQPHLHRRHLPGRSHRRPMTLSTIVTAAASPQTRSPMSPASAAPVDSLHGAYPSRLVGVERRQANLASRGLGGMTH
jgi:integrase/recombinase XerD